MDPATILVWLGAYLSGIGVLAWVVARRKLPPIGKNPPRERPERALYTLADRVLDALAKEHALVVDVDVARGKVNGKAVRIEVTPFGSAGDEVVRFHGSVRFNEPLGLEIEVSPRGIFNTASSDDPEVVSPEFDALYRVDALHVDQARALLSGTLEKGLMKAHRNGWKAILHDDRLLVEVGGRLGEQSVIRAMDWMIEAACQLRELRARVGLPELESEWKAAWKSVAEANAARFEIRSKTVRLELELGRLAARLDKAGERAFVTTIGFELARPLPFEIALSPAERWKKSDIQLGDEKFDEAFLVRGDPADAVKNALGTEARSALLELSEKCDHVVLDSTRVELRIEPPISDPDELGKLVVSLLRAVRALSPQRDKSAYR